MESTQPEALYSLATEQPNPATRDIDRLSALEIARLMNAEDATVPRAVEQELPNIARAIEEIAARLRTGGRLIYIGAGTSGRLGVLDASECPPTFNAPPGQVVGLIAGGPAALTHAIEGAEDNPDAGAADLQRISLSSADVVVGLAASGRTPYVLGAVAYARQQGALTIGIACNAATLLSREVDIMIAPQVGPEVVSGSTRLKAGTAQKLVLNMLSTGSMILLGKTFGNLMVDLQATNQKLRLRAVKLVQLATGLTEADAAQLLHKAGGETKTAILMGLAHLSPEEARAQLAAHQGVLRASLEAHSS
uniref:N-acetylmuramic acid 6-phosphate etherase n=1 Tax=Thermosporothrix sp. COM3 TaxID=2490863 RepID=A0A455SFW6_9CHLR|nr:N-acetylmuramic acid 6-phosphate etherase [Thermosporothrix sp. COM3]